MSLVMIIEDEEPLAMLLSYNLEKEGYEVATVSNGLNAISEIERLMPSVILLDWMLPEISGVEICKLVRSKPDIKNIPIIMLTAKSQEEDKIKGLGAGADDYVTKPFRMQELLVRIQALLRRCAAQKNIFYQSGDLIYNHHTCQLLKNNEVLDLSITEVKIITILLENWPRTIPREELLYQVWDKDSVFVEENTLSVNISRIREKLGLFENHSYITTVRGVGYRWAVSVKGK